MHTPLIDVYPVGILAAILHLGRAIRARHPQATRHALGCVACECRYIARQARARDWRAVRMATWRGWHAEHHYIATNAGTGWTRRQALADLYRHLADTTR